MLVVHPATDMVKKILFIKINNAHIKLKPAITKPINVAILSGQRE